MENNENVKVKRIGGYLHKLIPIKDSSGKILSYALKPFMIEFHFRDLLQVIVGATVLAIPLAFTEETWKLGAELPFLNVIALALISLLFIAGFVYSNFYRFNFKNNKSEYFTRVFTTYFCSLIIVGIILTLIHKCDWQNDYLTAIKRIIIVAFPASMSATISDTIK